MENSIELPCTYPVTCHTDYVTHDSTFVAIQGDTYDGSSFIPLALQKGASTIVVDTRAHLSQSLIDCIKSFKAEIRSEKLGKEAWFENIDCIIPTLMRRLVF